ncbi:hypothetical protein CMO88_03345 [Candidatus Woesearchaeota archaeon]|nr:hypothetical protein [Candidatus Woesearchaeota archaeon]|tara:strand:+ start:3400 stop:4497 length:1098 start_codon:yes stop_codon:yes gene_type:complete
MITIEDFKPSETYLFLESSYKRDLLEVAIAKAGSQRKLGTILKLDKGCAYQTKISTWLRQNNLRLDLIHALHKYLRKKLIVEKIKGLKSETTGGLITNIKFPVRLSPELANILAKLYCDGSVTKRNKYTTIYYNTCPQLISEYKEKIGHCFGNLKFSESKGHVYAVRVPNIIGKVLYKKFRLGMNRIPSQIMLADKEIKAAYLRAVFDDEGNVNKIHGQIRLKMKFKTFLQDVKQLLEEFSIETSPLGKDFSGAGHLAWYFVISGQYNLRKFYKRIGISHPDKKKKLRKRLRSYKQNTYGYKARFVILDILRKGGSKSVEDLANIAGRDRRTIQHHLNNLIESKLVKFTKVKTKYSFKNCWASVK